MTRPRRRRSGGRPDPPTLPTATRRAFALITLSIPVVVLLAAEGALRLAGVGGAYPLFVSADSAEQYRIMNPQVAKRFFVGAIDAPGVTHDPFRAVRTAATYRIVVQGGSTALGFPYFYGAAFSRMLEWRLQRTFPDREIEVVNTALTAVNSYTLLDFADEIIAERPDAVLIYAGHNEYYGVFGVGSSESLGSPRLVSAYLRLRRLRLVQILSRAYQAARGRWTREPGDSRQATIMERMVGEQRIPLGSALYARGMRQFRGNLEALLERYRRANIPVYVGTLVSNERDQPPFLSSPAPAVGPGTWQDVHASARAALAEGDTAGAQASIEDIVRRDSTDAEAFFALAQTFDRHGVYSVARRLYVGAKDRDQLRFRAPAEFNGVIRQAAGRSGARVVDVEAAFAAASPGGVVDGTLVTEHLHPNIEGYFLMADAFYEALRADGAIGPWDGEIPRGAARRDLPVTAVDSLYGELIVESLTAGWPFRDDPALEQRVLAELSSRVAQGRVEELALALYRREVTWPDAMAGLYAHYDSTGRHDRARHVARVLAQELPTARTPYWWWGTQALHLGDVDQAIAVFRTAEHVGETSAGAAMIGSLLLARGETVEALAQFRRAADLAPPDDPMPAAILDAATRLPALQERAVRAPTDTTVLFELAEAYVLTNQTARARAVLRDLVAVAPTHERAVELLSRLRGIAGD